MVKNNTLEVSGPADTAVPSFQAMTEAPAQNTAELSRSFWRDINRMDAEARGAASQARTAMERLAKMCSSHSNTGGTIAVRDILYSAFSGGATRADLGGLGALDWDVRKDVLAVLLAVNQPGFSDSEILQAMIRIGGQSTGDWFCERYDHEKTICRRALKR